MQAAKQTHHDAVTGGQGHPAAGVCILLDPQAGALLLFALGSGWQALEEDCLEGCV